MPFIRVPDANEGDIQKATDIGAVEVGALDACGSAGTNTIGIVATSAVRNPWSRLGTLGAHGAAGGADA